MIGVRVMRFSAAVVSMLVAVLMFESTAGAAPSPRDNARKRLDVYAGKVARDQLREIVALGVDRHELSITAASAGRVRVEAILSGKQAKALRKEGIALTAKRVDGKTAAQRATALAAEGFNVFRPYSGPGGLQEEFVQAAREHPKIAKRISIGKTVNGKDIIAVKVTKNARIVRDGRRPSVLYLGAQHAREWITPEMIRRLMHHVLDGYGQNDEITELVDENELWFVPVANPDGYDWTFTPGQRLWRKNLRDNNGDGQITPGDGVDPNRNFPTKWGYDNEGSSPDPASETYRGPGPASEPETQALDAFVGRVGFEFFVNYHSAAELLLYGTGWQVATPTPDDVIYEAMAGDDANPAVPGYDPDISAELYTTNGDTDTHMTEAYGTLGFTPEMSTCEAASDSVPDDEWEAADCGSGFEFPDDEELVQAEFEKNIPFALSVAESASDPDEPGVGRRPRGRGLPRRHLRRLLRRPADRRGRGQARPQAPDPPLPDQRQQDPQRIRLGMGGRRALRRRERRLLRRVPGPGARSRPRRRGRRLVHRRQAGRRHGQEPALRVHPATGHGRRRARDRERGLHRRQPDLPRRYRRAQVRRRARRRSRGRRL